jgi:hypothetical protein
MVRAVLKNGVIQPVEPLPLEWADGQELRVESMQEAPQVPEDLDQWYQELEAMVAQNDPTDIAKLEAALAEADKLAKEMVRREMGLS